MKKIVKEHRVLDDTDLNNINNTFKDIKQDNINNFNRIDNTFKLIEKTCDSINIRLNSMEKSNDIRHYTLLAVITVSSILLSVLKVLF